LGEIIGGNDVKILMTGRGTSGSFKIRGEQLGAAIGADVVARATDLTGYDLAILVKRPPMDMVLRLHERGIPICWDVVDAWPQPNGNAWRSQQCQAWLAEQVRIIRPAAIVAATDAMAKDCAVFGVPVLWLPHHVRPGLAVNPIREHVARVGYEGGQQYLGTWQAVLERACRVRGWSFEINPLSLAELDIVVALREQHGYATRFWKSGVKAANAQGSGTPIICNREAGYLETASGAERWADSAAELMGALDELAPHAVRVAAQERLLGAAPALALDVVAQKYMTWLRSLSFARDSAIG
jgi:hypothetical protein